MLEHPQFDPVALQLGPIAIHWYGLTYLLAFILFQALARQRLTHQPYARMGWTKLNVDDMMFMGVIGVILGGRLGYCLFYKPHYYMEHPLEILYVWQGGMSFHGGMLGVAVALIWFAHSRGYSWIDVLDFVAPCVPPGLAAGRLGNFINGELWGREASPTLPWAMVFPQSGTPFPRHPSQLYQIALEGITLFILLWIYARKERYRGQVIAAFLVGYGIFRFIAEYFREPDSYLGLLAYGLSMGQWLCIPMIAIGALWWIGAGLYGKKHPSSSSTKPNASQTSVRERRHD